MSYRVNDLSEHYRKMSDGELIELAREKDQLTPDARTALETEIASREIGEEELETETADASSSSPSESGDRLREVIFSDDPDDIPSSDLVAVYSAENETDAKELQSLLGSAGIESQLQIVVLVPQENAEEAIKIVSGKIDGEKDTRG